MTNASNQGSHTTSYDACPIPAAHRRLAEAHLLWHQALSNYQEPDAFRANLNATIQALRNITFALQSEKRSIANFDSWYSGWQARLAGDPDAKWLHNARTVVVHQGDLEITSSALVRVLTWKDHVLIESEIPPGAPTSLILANLPLLDLLKGSQIPISDLRNAALEIERRWSVAALKRREILEALARVYALLAGMAQQLKEHRATQAESLLKLGIRSDMVFATSEGGPIYRRNLLKRHFKPLLKAAKLPDNLTLYCLRHSCATLLLQAGIHPKIVSERLGHASIVLTLDTYSHVLPTMQDEATTQIQRMLYG